MKKLITTTPDKFYVGAIVILSLLATVLFSVENTISNHELSDIYVWHQPNLEANKIDVIPHNESFQIVTELPGWFEIKKGSLRGFVLAERVDKSELYKAKAYTLLRTVIMIILLLVAVFAVLKKLGYLADNPNKDVGIFPSGQDIPSSNLEKKATIVSTLSQQRTSTKAVSENSSLIAEMSIRKNESREPTLPTKTDCKPVPEAERPVIHPVEEIAVTEDCESNCQGKLDTNETHDEMIFPEGVSESQKKEFLFERFILQKFKKSRGFICTDRQTDINKKQYSADDFPGRELKYVFKKKAYRFAMECNYQSYVSNVNTIWDDRLQIERYLNYRKRSKIPVFIIIGVDGYPDDPNELYIIPLDELRNSQLDWSRLIKCWKNPESDFCYDHKKKKLS